MIFMCIILRKILATIINLPDPFNVLNSLLPMNKDVEVCTQE